MKSACRCESEEEFLLLLRLEQRRLRQLTEAETDQIIIRDNSRLDRFENLGWELRTVELGDCYVYPRMDKRPWAVGRVRDVSAKFVRLEPSSSRIWRMKLFASLLTRLPLIIVTKEGKLEIDDGSHRAIAMYLSGIRHVRAYVGSFKNA
jgi:hypothetical protein